MCNENDYESISRKADDLVAGGKRDQAQAVLKEGKTKAQTNGDQAFVHFFTGELAYLDGNLDEAIQEAKLAAESRPDSTLILRSLGVLFDYSGDADEAFQWFDKALALKPADVCSLRERAGALVRLERYEEALEWFGKALAVKPDDVASLYGRSAALAYLGRREEALEWIDKALVLKPDDVRSLWGRGTTLSNLGRHKEALKSLDRAMELDPEDRTTRRQWAVVLGLAGKTHQAVTELRKLHDEKPDDEYVREWLFRFLPSEEVVRLAPQRKRERERQRQEQRDREIKLEAWRTLSARSAHRIGNQVFAARGSLRTLRTEVGGELKEAVEDLAHCLDRVAYICNEFKQYSTIQPPHREQADVNLIIQTSVGRLQESAEGRRISAPPPPLLPQCSWDARQIEQVLTELLENAIRHTPVDGEITVTAEPFTRDQRQMVRIAVENTGEGVAADLKRRVFEPFFTERPGGSGLGLAIVQQIVQNHGGTIIEDGQPGRSARFVMELPARPIEGKQDEGPGH